MEFNTLEEAYKDVLLNIKNNGIISSPRGRQTKELLGYKFILTNPLNRIIGLTARDLNVYYLIGNFLWVMSQSNELDFISYYNKRGSMFSDDGKILRGAYGKRIFDFDGVNQYNQCIKELKIDPDSRRAIITFHLPQHDWSGSLDTPCTASVQFLIRNNKLVMINHMRSQSAAMVMPYDIFLMTMIQEFMAIELGVELGEYIHFCGSIHYFNNENELVDVIINSNEATKQMGNMPKETNMIMLKKLLGFERELREDVISTQKFNLDFNAAYWFYKLTMLDLPNYWYEFGEILILKAMEYKGKEIKYNTLSQYSKAFQRTFIHFI